jgi:hypothetical protein
VEAFSPVDGPTNPNKKRRAATIAVAAVGLSSFNKKFNVKNGSPFRGSLNSRPRHRQQLHSRISSSRDVNNDDFALRMLSTQSSQDEDDYNEPNNYFNPDENSGDATTVTNKHSPLIARRKFLSNMLAAASSTATAAAVSSSQAATAYEQAYPIELTATPYGMPETSSNSLNKLQQERLSNKKAKVAATKDELTHDPLGMNQVFASPSSFGLTVGGTFFWSLSLWLASGSRSNPLVNPVANILYDEKDEKWLQDRNAGYFGDLPLSLMIILSAIFVCLGVLLDRSVYFLADGDAEVSLQLAGVSVIGGAVWEVGRLSAKEKPPTREEHERDVMLYKEFDEFASKRLIVGKGSCHRTDVIAAFRRYNPKYRVADNEEYPLSDVEIERILRKWNKRFGSKSEMSSAGFFAGITVDGAADAFAPR